MDKKMAKKLVVPSLCLALTVALPACGRNQGSNAASTASPAAKSGTGVSTAQSATSSPAHGGHGTTQSSSLNDASYIPYYSGPKTQTTNEQGARSYGLGTSVYSVIGSSGLHSNGFSSHLESRLSGAGVDGVNVFVVDDMVILAAESPQSASIQYDPMQQKVLSNTGGQSGRGPEPGSNVGTSGTMGHSDDSLTVAAERIKSMMGTNVTVRTIYSKEAVDTIKRIRSRGGSHTPEELSTDVRKLMQLTAGQK